MDRALPRRTRIWDRLRGESSQIRKAGISRVTDAVFSRVFTEMELGERKLGSDVPAGVMTKSATRTAWVAFNYEARLGDLADKAQENAAAYLVVNLLVIGGGFATSGIAIAGKGSHGSTSSWVVFAIGLVVAIAGGLSQQFRFGFRSSERRTLALAFEKEGWHYALPPAGAYTGDPGEDWKLFVERIDKLNERAAAVESVETELPKRPRKQKQATST